MACRLFGAKPLPEPILPYCQLDPKEHISVNFDSKYELFIDQNALENVVWEMAAILFRGDELNAFCRVVVTPFTFSAYWI